MRARALVLLLAAAAGAALTLAGGDRSNAAADERPPVVLLIFDEFPVDDLLRPDGRIDAERFPNFAKLAPRPPGSGAGPRSTTRPRRPCRRSSTRRLPRKGTVPGPEGHPSNVFTLFDSLGYGIEAAESVTSVCPTSICASSTPATGVIDRLRGNERPARLRRWAASMHDGPPTLYVHHALLPHEPWIYLPSGRQTRPGGKDPVGAINRPIGFHDQELTDHNHLRHLLQVGSVDRDLGSPDAPAAPHRAVRPRARGGGGRSRLLVRGRRAATAGR